mgnify:CR=1 FL=1
MSRGWKSWVPDAWLCGETTSSNDTDRSTHPARTALAARRLLQPPLSATMTPPHPTPSPHHQAGVTFWLDFGTLMSLARANDVYESDNDVDLVVLNPDFGRLKEQLSRPGVLPKG